MNRYFKKEELSKKDKFVLGCGTGLIVMAGMCGLGIRGAIEYSAFKKGELSVSEDSRFDLVTREVPTREFKVQTPPTPTCEPSNLGLENMSPELEQFIGCSGVTVGLESVDDIKNVKYSFDLNCDLPALPEALKNLPPETKVQRIIAFKNQDQLNLGFSINFEKVIWECVP